ncbi:MAG: hypothetical protein ACE5DX_03130 [Candidatus Dojkabacteria bacterium]
MDKTMKKEDLLESVRKLVKDEGVDNAEIDEHELIDRYALEAVGSSKDVLGQLYFDFTSGRGILRKIKNLVIDKIANVSRNTVERSLMKQQRFNDNTALLLRYLYEENRKLTEKIRKLEKKK